ncbi:MAG: amidohydrolase family protein, partial [Planctomycetota bacterium]
MEPGSEPLQGAEILVAGGKIVAVVEAGASLPELFTEDGKPLTFRDVPLEGAHVVPGLIDSMVNHDPDHDVLYLASGVTLVRDLGNDLGRILDSKRPASRDAAPGPALHIAGGILAGSPPVTTEAVVVTHAEEAADKLPRLFELGVDYISFHLRLGLSQVAGGAVTGSPRETLAAVAEISHANDRKVWGPRLPSLTLQESIELGQDGFLYLDAFLTEGDSWGGKAPEAGKEPETLDEATRRRLALIQGEDKRMIPLAPGMRLYAHRLDDPGDDPPVLMLLGPHYASGWSAERDLRRSQGGEAYRKAGRRAVEAQRALLASLFGAGVSLVPGSGAPNPWILPGVGLHDELREWRECGLSAEATLAAATRGAAEALGLLEERGTITAGKIADLVVCKEDPRLLPDSLRNPQHVVLRGMHLPRTELDARVEALVQKLTAVREAAKLPVEIEPLDFMEGGTPLLSGRVRTEGYGQRISEELYAVSRGSENEMIFLSRVVTPGTATYGTTTLWLRQELRGRLLESFEARINFGTEKDEVRVRGMRLGGQLRVQQQWKGEWSQQGQINQPISFIDAGSITSSLNLQHLRPQGS